MQVGSQFSQAFDVVTQQLGSVMRADLPVAVQCSGGSRRRCYRVVGMVHGVRVQKFSIQHPSTACLSIVGHLQCSGIDRRVEHIGGGDMPTTSP